MEILLQLAKEQGFIVATLFMGVVFLARQYKAQNEKNETKLAEYEKQNQAKIEKMEIKIQNLENKLDEKDAAYAKNLESIIAENKKVIENNSLVLSQTAQTLRTFCELFSNKNLPFHNQIIPNSDNQHEKRIDSKTR